MGQGKEILNILYIYKYFVFLEKKKKFRLIYTIFFFSKRFSVCFEFNIFVFLRLLM
jgi:hypothetical protein